MKLNATTALKASLLLVLAANMSWEKIDFGSAQLAATGTPAEAVKASATNITPSVAEAPTSTSPAELSARMAKAPAPEAKAVQPSHTSKNYLKVCGDDYQVHYQQYEENRGAIKTRIAATRVSNQEDGLEIIVPGKIMDLIELQESSSTNARLTREIKAMRAEKKLACAGESSATLVAAADPKTEEEKKKLAEDVKNCKTNNAGDTLKGERVTACWIKAVEQVEKRVDKKDSDGKRISETARERALYAEITKIARILKADIKKGLLSKDESRVEEAREQLKDAMDAIIAGGSSLGGDDERGYDNKISKIIAEFEALDKAADTRKEALVLKEKAEDSKRYMRESYQDLMRDPLNPQTNDEYDRAKYEFNLLRNEIYRDFELDELARLNRYKSSRLISSQDFTDFVKPYTELQRLMKEALSTPATVSSTQSFSGQITGSVMGSEYTPAANLAATRAERSAEAARMLGTTAVTTQTRPTVQPNMTLQAPRGFGQ